MEWIILIVAAFSFIEKPIVQISDFKIEIQTRAVSSIESGQTARMCRLAWLYTCGKPLIESVQALYSKAKVHCDSTCECEGDDSNQECECEDYSSDGYTARIAVIAVAAALVVGVTGIIICCCVYSKTMKQRWTKTLPETPVEVQYVDKNTPPHELIWNTLPRAPPPQYSGTTLPYYHPGTRDTTLSPPPPYKK